MLPTHPFPRRDRMDIHKNARLTPLGRERLVRLIERGHTPQHVASSALLRPGRCGG